MDIRLVKSTIACCALLLTISSAAMAQERRQIEASTNTSTTARVENPPKQEKHYRSLYRRDTKKAPIGNRCVEELTRQMGFRYELIPAEGPGSKTGTGVFLHNAGNKFILFFRNGPFWELRLRKKIRECRKKTGDYVG